MSNTVCLVRNDLLWRGVWATGAVYAVGDAVSHLGQWWACNTAHTAASGNQPGTGGQWTATTDIVPLNDGVSCWVTEYAMRTPDPVARPVEGPRDGTVAAPAVYKDVTETISLLIVGATVAATRDVARAIERLLDLAREQRTAQGGSGCYVQVQIAGETTAWRSEVLRARLAYADPLNLWQSAIRADLTLTRRYYWEQAGPEVALQMSSQATGTPTTGPVTWHNGADNVSGQRNWVNIAAAQVQGTLPAPLKLDLKMTAATTFTMVSFYVGNYVWMDPTGIDPIFVGAESGEGTGNRSWTTSSEFALHTWTMPAALQEDVNGRYVRPLIAYSTKPSVTTNMRATVAVALGGDIDIFLTDPIFPQTDPWGTSCVVDFGPVPLPPGGYTASPATLKLRFFATKAGGDAVNAHSLHLFPHGPGVLRRYRAGGGLSLIFDQNSGILDDGITGRVVAYSGTGARFPFVVAHGSPLMVWPGRVNRLRMLNAPVTWAASVAWTAQAWYRPRRLVL